MKTRSSVLTRVSSSGVTLQTELSGIEASVNMKNNLPSAKYSHKRQKYKEIKMIHSQPGLIHQIMCLELVHLNVCNKEGK